MNYTKVSRAASLRSARIAADIQTLINNRSYYKFQYTPLTGPLPGLSFEQQTEDAINDIGNMSYGSYEIATQALTTANQAYNAAQSAIEIANHAETTAQNAQTTANNAATAAANAQTAADNAATAAANAQTTADNAATAAANAQETADNAQASANTAIATATTAQTTADNAQNDATSALNRLDSLTPVVEELRYYDNIDTAVDLNDKTEFARELLEASNNTNAPETGSGWLDVDDDFNETYIRQKFMGQASGKTYVRFGTIVPDSDPVEVSEWTAWVEYAVKTDLDSTTTELTARMTTVANNLATHEANYNNPHKVTAEQLGLTTVYQYKGSVATYADLPTSGQKIGDVYNIETADPDHGIKAGDNVAWDGTQWDILGGNHDLSGYAQLAANNVFSGVNTFEDATIINGVTQITSGSLRLEKDGVNTISFGSATFGNSKLFSDGTNLIYGVPENASHTYYINNQSVYSIQGILENVSIRLGNKTFAQNSSNGIAVKNIAAPTADTDAANKKYVDDAVAAGGGGGGGDVTAAGDNNFTGTNTFNKAITVRDGALAGIGGTITLGMKPNSATTQAKINSTTTGAMYYTATEGLAHFFNVGTTEVATVGGTETTATLDFLANRILDYSTSSGLKVGGGGTNKTIALYPEAADNTAGMRLLNQEEAINTDYSTFSLQNNSAISYTKNAALQVGNFNILEVDKNNNNVTIKADSNGQILFTPNNLASNTSSIDTNGNLYISQGLTVGSMLNTGTSNGVIRAGNNESCLYFTGTAENTYYATPNTGNTISYQAAANCYLINCSINDPSSLNMNFSGMKFKATVGSIPYMCKTLTFWLAVGATVPTVAWTFPTGSAVYYPKGVAPALTANANNIINVIAIVDDTGNFSIQVCDSVALPFSG